MSSHVALEAGLEEVEVGLQRVSSTRMKAGSEPGPALVVRHIDTDLSEVASNPCQAAVLIHHEETAKYAVSQLPILASSEEPPHTSQASDPISFQSRPRWPTPVATPYQALPVAWLRSPRPCPRCPWALVFG